MNIRTDPCHDRNDLNALLEQAITIASAFDPGERKQATDILPIDELTSLLYREWYTDSSREKPNGALPQIHWPEVFRAAHHGTYRWESGWIASRVSTAGRVIAIRGEEQRILYPGDYVSLIRPGLPPLPGTEIEAVSRRDSSREQPGFWLTYSGAWENATHPIVRLYLNTSPHGAVCLVDQVTRHLPDDMPYCLKLPVDLAGYQRTDATVLYLEGSQFDRVHAELHAIYAKLEAFLYPETPPLTKKLGPGIGLAEDPIEASESFGLHRCRLIAEGLLAAKRADQDDPAAIRDSIGNHLSKGGIDLARPHLNPGAMRDYSW